MRMNLFAAFACITLAVSAPARATEKPLFASDDKIHIAIQAPLSTLIRNRSYQGKIAGTLTDPNGQSLPITLELRGITRRTSEVCDFPPVRVAFATPPPPTSLFAGQKKLKLITHCRNAPSFRQYVLLEYAAYRMYNLLTPRSFRAKLADIDYRGSDGRPLASQVGFFLEDLDDLAQRNGMRKVRGGDRIPFNWLSSPDAARYALFQHMLGNHDWSMRAGPVGKDCCHNAELIGAGAPGQAIPVPYDFDFSGMVDAPYATAPAELNIADVKDRFYRGYCAHNADVLAVARQMRTEQPRILGVLAQVPGLEPHTQQRAAAYLSRFFADIDNDADVGSKVVKRCLGNNP
jgi:hypothetical protein